MNLPEFRVVIDPNAEDPETAQSIELPYVPLPDDVMADAKDHGTCVASLATGAVNGVAKKARLVPIRYRNDFQNAAAAAVQDAWRWVINDVIAINKGANGNIPPPGETVKPFSILLLN